MSEIENLRHLLRDAEEKNQLGTQQLAEAEKLLSRTRADLKHLQEKESRFRDIILDKAGVQKVSDDEVRDAFLKVRQRVQGIMKTAYFGDLSIDKSQIADLSNDNSKLQFYRKMDTLGTRKDRSLRARAKIFSMLYFRILSAPCFNISGPRIALKFGKDIDPADLEDRLVDFEEALEQSKGEQEEFPTLPEQVILV